MSHEATTWAIRQRGLPPAAKLVLWHLCDRYHPDHGCFPRQDTLAEDCEMSRSSINNHLNVLEERGLIRRIAERDARTKKQRVTRYRFAFEEGFAEVGDRENPCPDIGHGGGGPAASRVQNSGRAVSNCLDTTGEPLIEPVTTPQSPPAEIEPQGAGGIASVTTRSLGTGSTDREQGEASAGEPGDDGDGAREGERGSDAGTDRSAAARKAAETRTFDKLVREWPGGASESQKRIRVAWDALSAQEKRDAAERAETYRRDATKAGHKRPRLGAYLAERRFGHVRAPVRRTAAEDGGPPANRLKAEVVEAFLAHEAAREVLALAARDGLVSSLADDVAKWHRLTSVARYREKRGEWIATRERVQQPLDDDSQVNIALRTLARSFEQKAAKWQAFADGVLGWSARDGPGGERETGVAKRANG